MAFGLWRMQNPKCMLQDSGREEGMLADDRAEVQQELAEATALLQQQWAARVGLPELRISQRVGKGLRASNVKCAATGAVTISRVERSLPCR